MSEETVEILETEGSVQQEMAPEEDFAALFEKESKMPGRLDPGQKIKTKVISISGEMVYVDLGGKSEGVIDLAEFSKEDGTVVVKEGDEIEAYFLSVQNGTKRLTTRLRGYSTIDIAGVRDAYHANLPVTGKVKSAVKGGYEVSVGGARCFCPFSQMDLKVNRDSNAYVGETFSFKVVEFENDGRNIVLSRRALLEEERQAQAERFKETLSVGMELTGKVRSIQNFGAFVDLGAIDGLIPASEIGWDRTARPDSVLSVGQEVNVKVIGLDWEKNRLTLSLKALLADPWDNAAARYTPDTRVKGVIVRLTPFGAFVNLEPGIDGLVHISQLGAGRHVHHPKEVVEVGQSVEPYVLAVDAENRKISLSLEDQTKEEVVLPEVGEVVDGAVERVMPYGIFLKLDSGASGLIPNSEMGTPKGSNHSRMFPVGTRMQVVVIGADKQTKKISFSRNAVSEKVERDDFKNYRTELKGEEKSSAGLSSFGELLQRHLQSQKSG
ncbi:MAG: 30S ribosomal protein S1 [Syntrophorhabdaceae bacterium PtaU1.Bin034]|jgi:small subunit ribosomal protein S1|nr:MAG: 30S ribosomal protein S1 [Syntrophorhabdaceae bacterium PtaU1.Bin034]